MAFRMPLHSCSIGLNGEVNDSCYCQWSSNKKINNTFDNKTDSSATRRSRKRGALDISFSLNLRLCNLGSLYYRSEAQGLLFFVILHGAV